MLLQRFAFKFHVTLTMFEIYTYTMVTQLPCLAKGRTLLLLKYVEELFDSVIN